jgi:hypothetical protein
LYFSRDERTVFHKKDSSSEKIMWHTDLILS